MFVGHTAVAFAVKARAPRASLGVYVAAAYALDLLWPIFLALGIERVRIDPDNTRFTPLAFDSYPWTHSLAMAIVWGFLAALAARKLDREARLWVFLLVVSHWVLDFVSHRPDMPLWPGRSPLLGLGLWNSIAATLAVEGAMFAAGVAMYVRATRASDRRGSVGLWLFVALQLLLWASQPWSPPPPGVGTLVAFGFAAWLFPLWAAWFDRHRTV
ncbi:MAG TPA: metal-dependent hydrolase [Candidatus Polarisedimenticolaceae bacterium]|nr:metal-dependent hydrolase [Candidatus Polarisedimenticolaceae bacterium]